MYTGLLILLMNIHDEIQNEADCPKYTGSDAVEMARSSEETTTDLRCVPQLTLAYVEKYVVDNCRSSGEENLDKGFMYYSEGYVHRIRTSKFDDGCRVSARCYHLQRRNEPAHTIEFSFKEACVVLGTLR
ncbi:uncharacterized protein LOC124123851 [Haliotis rufescens]|uniref:uncharacterized protein LOC124123851 n=1 Tax=Haliotis rufescens TaxID=6454 RepID=UPI00201EABC8|nr:uncharacterized protein LOC124123851 [Haliotis rufescens]